MSDSSDGNRVISAFLSVCLSVSVHLFVCLSHRPAHTWALHEKRLTCVHVNPVDDNYFVSAAADRCVSVCVCVCVCVCHVLLSSTVRIWDMRHMSAAIQRLRVGRMVSSAYFSPLTGCRLLMTSLDNCIRCLSCDIHVIIFTYPLTY